MAIARRDKVRIIPTGVQALNKLGLSTQVPMKLVYLTDGGTRNIKVGKRTISFRNTSPKNLFMKGEISSMVIQALKTIGNSKLDDSTLRKIQNILKKEKKDNITFRLNVNNLFDEVYLSELSSNIKTSDNISSTNAALGTYQSNGRVYNGIADGNQGYFGLGRTWNFGLRYNF